MEADRSARLLSPYDGTIGLVLGSRGVISVSYR
jgi:hypothetical protein